MSIAAMLDRAIAEARLRAANKKLSFWMSAALEDPEVCEEMKADIRAWFEAQAYDAERA